MEYIEFTKRLTSKSRALDPNRRRSIKFNPLFSQKGIHGEILVLAVDPGLGKGGKISGFKPGSGGDIDPKDGSRIKDINIKFQGGIEVSLFVQGVRTPIHKVKTRSTKNPKAAITFDVPKNRSGKTWHCKIVNKSNKRLNVATSIFFVEKRLPARTTSIPYRVLNGAASEILKALEPKIKLDGKNSFIDFSSELKNLAGGRLKKIRFNASFPVKIDQPSPFPDLTVKIKTKDINLLNESNKRPVTVFARNKNGIPKIIMDIAFEKEGPAELAINNFPDIDLAKISARITMSLSTTNEPVPTKSIKRGKFVGIRMDANVDIKPRGVTGSVVNKVKNIRKEAQKKIQEFLNNNELRTTISSFLTKGIMQLAHRGDILIKIASNNENILVTHYNKNSKSVAIPPRIGSHVPPEIKPPFPLTSVNKGSPDLSGMENLEKIDHIVFLMMENRSFDHMLGYLSKFEGREDIDGLKDLSNLPPDEQLRQTEQNSIKGLNEKAIARELEDTVFKNDPNHDHKPVLSQINDGRMNGFAQSFFDKFGILPEEEHPLEFYTKKHLHTYDFLANEFLICNNWYASHPGPTWPNRLITLSGTAPEKNNFKISDPRLGYLNILTVFDHLNRKNIDWCYYERDITFLRMFDRYRLDNSKILPFEDPVDGFFKNINNLPPVTFIDPNFTDLPPVSEANDDHPPADILNGQRLVCEIYNALIKSNLWEKMLFVITYDEHGGFFDHVPPPGTSNSGVKDISRIFDDVGILGVRVPAFVISPFVKRKSISDISFEHTSIIKTIMLKFFGENHPDMGPRVHLSNNLGAALNLDVPRKNVPECEIIPAPSPRPRGKPARIDKKSDNFHDAMNTFGLPIT